jgi:hypothetical protein
VAILSDRSTERQYHDGIVQTLMSSDPPPVLAAQTMDVALARAGEVVAVREHGRFGP